MANEAQVAVLLLGVPAWNDWRHKQADRQPDLSEIRMPEANLTSANLAGANLRAADLHGADLAGADLSGADLGQANLRGANLHHADLNWSYLRDADLRGADAREARLEDAYLEGADLSSAELTAANLTGADLRGANLSGATCVEANFVESAFGSTRLGDVDLSNAKGLDRIRHLAPSTIGLDTVYRSKGIIPELFLRGAGVPDPFIRFVNSLPQKQDRTYSCFIAHSLRDSRFCDRLFTDLQGYGVRAWAMPEEAARSRRFFSEITASPRMFEKVIVVLSKNSLQDARVLREVEDTLRREHGGREHILYPIRLDNFAAGDSEQTQREHLATRAVADFCGWNRNPARYEKGLKQLLSALQVGP